MRVVNGEEEKEYRVPRVDGEQFNLPHMSSIISLKLLFQSDLDRATVQWYPRIVCDLSVLLLQLFRCRPVSIRDIRLLGQFFRFVVIEESLSSVPPSAGTGLSQVQVDFKLSSDLLLH